MANGYPFLKRLPKARLAGRLALLLACVLQGTVVAADRAAAPAVGSQSIKVETPSTQPVQRWPQISRAMNAALEKLPVAARPEEVRLARNGALYALLPNGLELILLERRSAPVVALQAWIRTGTIHEEEWSGAGLSHFCEHLLFKGTAKRKVGMVDRDIRSAGGINNAYTTSERTVYHITASKEGLAACLEVLADMVLHSNLPPEEVKNEHAVVVKEIERYLDDPENVLWETFQRTRYQTHPYRVPVLGYPDRFAKVTREEVFAYYQRRYVPQLTTWIAVGDFAAEEVLPLMASSLASWPRRSVQDLALAEEPEQVAPREVEITHPLCRQPKMLLGFPTVGLRHPDLYALDLLAVVLGGGKASRLYQVVKERGQLAYEIDASSNTPRYAGSLTVSFNTDEDKLERTRELVLAVLEQARLEKPSEKELERAKRLVRTRHLFAQLSADQIAHRLGTDWLNAGDLDFSQRYVEAIQAVNGEEVQRVARRYLQTERLNQVLLLPEQNGRKIRPANSGAAAFGKADAQARLSLLQTHPDVRQPRVNRYAGAWVSEFTLVNGIRVLVREDPALPAVHASLALLGGQRQEPPEQAGIGKLLAGMFQRGTRKLPKELVDEFVEGLGAEMTAFGGRNAVGLSLRALKEDFPKLLSMGSECLFQASCSGEELEKLRKGILAKIEEQQEDLWELNDLLFKPLVYGPHPYGRPVIGTKESISKVSSAQLWELYQQWARPERLAIAFVGDLTLREVLEWMRKQFPRFEAKPAPPPPPQLLPMPALQGRKECEARRAGIKGTLVQLGFRGVSLGDPDRFGLDVLRDLLSGLGGRLSTSLREEQGLAYSVGAYNDVQLDGGAFVFYVRTDEAKLGTALEGVWKVIQQVQEVPVPEEELRSVKSYLCGTEAIALQDLGDLAQRLALGQLFKEDTATLFDRRERIQRVTVAEIQRLARKYLTQEAWVKAVVRPGP